MCAPPLATAEARPKATTAAHSVCLSTHVFIPLPIQAVACELLLSINSHVGSRDLFPDRVWWLQTECGVPLPIQAVACELLLSMQGLHGGSRQSVVFYDTDPSDGVTKTAVLKLDEVMKNLEKLVPGLSSSEEAVSLKDREGPLFCDDQLSENLFVSFVSGTDFQLVADKVLADTKGMSEQEIEEQLGKEALNYYDQEHRRGSDRKNSRGGIGLVTIADDLFREDLLQGMLRMRALINEEHKDYPQKVHAVVPAAVADQVRNLLLWFI